MRKTIVLLMIMMITALSGVCQKVNNVRFEQEGKTVKIYYDLSSNANVSVYYSTDGGRNYYPIGSHVSGNIGANVLAGNNRCVVWSVLEDMDKLSGNNITFKVKAASLTLNLDFTVKGVKFSMIYVEGGTFTMGATTEQGSDAESDEMPAHQVTLSNYYIGETEVTQALWYAVMGTKPSYFKGSDNLPVESISYDDALEFCRKLSNITGRKFRLPTEAEWEYAARGGKKSKGYKYSGSNNIGMVAWYWYNSGKETHIVKSKSPNELGIYDMSGNVWEWCFDWYNSDYYKNSTRNNPQGPFSGSFRVLRGGSWDSDAVNCRLSFRYSYFPYFRSFNYGLRLALSL